MTGSTLSGNKVWLCSILLCPTSNQELGGEWPDKRLYCYTYFLLIFPLSQVRKLEFLLADALHQGCDSVVTCGSIQSNHARATAVAARQLGMKPHLVLRWPGEIVSQ